MKILFLCGALEPGRDGVGDYVRRLAVELARQGHQTAGISLNDQFLSDELSTHRETEANAFSTLRLPATWPARRRFARARQRIAEFEPEWLSLQFVPFSFHFKGLPFLLSKQLATMGQGKSWHFMFHELWVGMDRESTTKYIWWGRVQRLIVKALINRLHPRAIHTQTPLYQAHLANLGVSAQLLPLFANIPNVGEYGNGPIPWQGLGSTPEHGIDLVTFGTIHPGAPIADFAHDAARYAKQHALSVTLTMVGRCGAEQDQWAAHWRAAGLPVRILGEQTPDCISAVLQQAAFGITTTPVALIGKSGTAAAMREHGLPVLCLSRPWIPLDVDNPATPAGVFAYSKGNFASFLTKAGCAPSHNTLSSVAQQFATALMKA